MQRAFYYGLFSIFLSLSCWAQGSSDLLAVIQYPKQPVAIGKQHLLLVTVKADKTWQSGRLTVIDSSNTGASKPVESDAAMIGNFALPANKKIYSYYLPITVLQDGILDIKGSVNVKWPKIDEEVAYPLVGFGVVALQGQAFFGRNTEAALSRMAQYHLKQRDEAMGKLLEKNQQGNLSSQEWQVLYQHYYLIHQQLSARLTASKPHSTADEDRVIHALLTNDRSQLTSQDLAKWNDLLTDVAASYRYIPLYFESSNRAELNQQLPTYVYKARESGTVTAVFNSNGYFVPEMTVNDRGASTYSGGNHYVIRFTTEQGKDYRINIKKPSQATGLYNITLYKN